MPKDKPDSGGVRARRADPPPPGPSVAEPGDWKPRRSHKLNPGEASEQRPACHKSNPGDYTRKALGA